MSATISTPRPAVRTSTGSGLSAAGIVRSEWIKLRSLRSTVWSFAILILVSLGMAFLLATTVDGTGAAADGGTQALIQASAFGVTFGVLVAAVLGVLVISGEYTTGMSRSTFTAVPKRVPALVAKAFVLFVTTYVVGIVASIGSAAVTLAVFSGKSIQPEITVDVVTSILLAALYLAFVAVFALGIGTILRSSAGGIAVALAILLVLPTVLTIIAGVTQAQWAIDLMPYILSSAGEAMILPSENGLEIWQSTLTVAIWAIVPFVLGAVLLKRRDA